MRALIRKLGQTRVFLLSVLILKREHRDLLACYANPWRSQRRTVKDVSVACWSALHTPEALQSDMKGKSEGGRGGSSFEVLLRNERLQKGEKEEGKVTWLRSERKSKGVCVCVKE